MRRIIILCGFLMVMLSVMGQDNPYIVKTKGVKKTVRQVENNGTIQQEAEAEPQDWMGKNFRFYSMCDWRDGMRFMVIPEKYDLLVGTFRDYNSGREVGNGKLRHHILVYKGHEAAPNGREHVLFSDEADNTKYYFELPLGAYEDYCYSRHGVPTLAFLGDVDKARELLLNQKLMTLQQLYRVDTDYDSDGFKEVTVEKNMEVTVKAIGVGTRDFPVKIIVEDDKGNQFFQNVVMSKTNCGLRDDEFIMDNEKFLFQKCFEFRDTTLAATDDTKAYLNKVVHTKGVVEMTTNGAGEERKVLVPLYTNFIIDEITPVKNSRYYRLTMRETETRQLYFKKVAFKAADVDNERNGSMKDDLFSNIFGMGGTEVKADPEAITKGKQKGDKKEKNSSRRHIKAPKQTQTIDNTYAGGHYTTGTPLDE